MSICQYCCSKISQLKVLLNHWSCNVCADAFRFILYHHIRVRGVEMCEGVVVVCSPQNIRELPQNLPFLKYEYISDKIFTQFKYMKDKQHFATEIHLLPQNLIICHFHSIRC